jgi:predicted nuclease of restriction endonuclease-like (RecB) superfamily
MKLVSMNKMINKDSFDFESLVNSIKSIHNELAGQASKAVNVSLTIRNWLIGMYIAEYQLNGKDRAKYGDKLLYKLADRLKNNSNCNHRQLYRYHRLYQLYPQILGTLSPKLKKYLPAALKNGKVGTVSPKLHLTAEKMLTCLSYSHFEQLADINDETKRIFYEIESIRGNWSVRELKRQIGSLYYERSGLSINKEKLSQMANISAEEQPVELNIRDPFVFEFLGLKSREVMAESDLEDELISKIEEFLLELGHGFCFEARQKRILIGDEYFFVDLVFYHRVLKCHVLIDLKLKKFNQENIGQLNTYVSWYKKNMMTEGDNPPVGILLCTDKNHALVEYALAGMDNNLFVSKYLLELPKKEEMQKFIEEKLKERAE